MRDVFPQLKSEYIEKGHVRYVFREFPLDQVALTASVVGRCLPRESYLAYVDLMYGELETWVQQEDLRASIKEMARRAGMTGEDFEKCLSTDEDAKKLIAGRTKATEDYCIGGTPTFFVNNQQIAGRTLLKHFREFHGVSPMRYVRNHRLQRAREDLLGAGALAVSEVALHWGFTHLGRFAAEYRRRFGESPSSTRARARH